MKFISKLCIVVLIVFVCSTVFAGQWVYKPMSINAQKGDIILSTSPGFIMDLLAILGCYWSHSGMAVDNGFNIRHNTMYVSEVPIEYNYIWFIKTTPKRMDPNRLSNGLPGILTEDIDTTYNVTKNFHAAGGAVLKPTAANEALYRQYLQLAADKLLYVKAYYRVNAYVNMYQLDYVNYYITGRGNHCSGTCWYANYFAGKTMNVAYIPPSLVTQCAFNLYNSVKNMVRDEAGGFGAFIIDIEGLFGTGADEKIANQIVNTFGWDRSWDTSAYWRSYINQKSATANAPDHLLLYTYKNPSGYYPGVQTTSSSYYGQVDPLVITSGYYYWVD
ncbi:MAG: hypothetical protein N3F66_01135 [Spirochaetes bacterium]|nr:hypothetical protein [Spirochaetota bacterium]